VSKYMNGRWRLEPKLCFKLKIKTPSERIRRCDLLKLITSLKLKKACVMEGIPNECLRHLPRRPPISLITVLVFHTFPRFGRKRKWWPYRNQIIIPNSHKTYVGLAFYPRGATFFKNSF
jgi:hypothetical protein